MLPDTSFPPSPKQGRMTKAPFSVEWLSQSSQALQSPTEGSPRRASSGGQRPGSGSSLGRSERSQEQPAGPRDGTGGRSRERAATPAAGTATPGQPGAPGRGAAALGHPRARESITARWLSGAEGRGRLPTRCPDLADPFVLVAVSRSRREAIGSGAARAGRGCRVPGARGAVRARRAAAAHGVQRGADQHPGELLPAAAVPGRGRAPAAGGQDAPLRGAGERHSGHGGTFPITT